MRNEILKKIDEVKEILTEHLKEPVRFVDVFKEDSDPKKVLANLLSVLGAHAGKCMLEYYKAMDNG